MKKTFADAVAILTLCAPVASQAFTIRGQPDCGSWVNSRQESKTDPIASLRNETWVIGYLSGIVMGAGDKTGDPLSKYSNDQIFLYLDNYCRANPLKKAGDGVVELIVNDVTKKR